MMKTTVLRNTYNSKSEVKAILKKNGFPRFYDKGEAIIVEQSDEIKISVGVHGPKLVIKSLFPSIGSTIQIIVTVLLLILFFFVSIPLFWLWAILGGQVIAYLYYSRKGAAEREKIIQLLK